MQEICLLRLSAIGDTTHVLPVIATIQKRYPQARITWIIGTLEHKLIQGLEGVEFIVFNKSGGFKEMGRLRRLLKSRRFDVLLHMQLSFRANLIGMMVRAGRKIGFDKNRSKELHSLAINERVPFKDRIHVLDGFMQFAEAIDAGEPVYKWPVTLSDEDHAFAQSHVLQQPAVIISHSSSHALRNWLPDRYAAVADYLVEKFNAQVFLCGGPAPREKRLGAEIASLCQQSVIDLTGQDTLKQLMAMMQAVDLVISPDSGPLHMAGAAGTPVIGLHGGSNYRRSGSYQFPQLVVDVYPQACEEIYGKPIDALKWGIKAEQQGVMEKIQTADVCRSIDRWYNDFFSKANSVDGRQS
ncbi:glycosyltransferase family 9 protein [Marinicella sp. W31]|uniref:glycosyltransferase family 9 protein n=1 Tax=Marinicella sp. W31 TaxID=3023713 RepID=UPI003756DF9D